MAIILSGFLWWHPQKAHAQTDTFTSSGTWNVPAGVTSADFEAWGAGGAGGAGNNQGGTNRGGGGGKGGEYAIKNVTGLVTNDAYTVTVAGTTASGNGTSSSITNPSSTTFLLACGGTAGADATTGADGGGATAQTTGCTHQGTSFNAGGNGASGATNGGGGGGGAGSTGAGGAASGSTAGSGTGNNGGNGGGGATSNSAGSNGSIYGGAGGGGRRGGNAGGTGAAGFVTVTYTVSNSSPNAPTLSNPANAATVSSTTPSFGMFSTDPESDHMKFDILIYNTSSTSGGNCSGSLYIERDENTTQTGWSGQTQDGSTTYGDNDTATYTVQAGDAVTRGSSYCWQAKAKDPSGSGNFGNISSALTFTVDSAPSTPSLSTPASGATGVSITPSFTLSSTDSDSGDYLTYRIYLYQSDCSTPVGSSPFDEAVSQTGWSGQDANSGAAYASGTTASCAYQSTLSNSTTYCWKADATDSFSATGSTSSTQSFTTASAGGTEQVNIGGGVNITGGTNIY